jgi:RNA polymerase sigma factor (sigma-70 family)
MIQPTSREEPLVTDAEIVARSLDDPHVFEQLVISLGPRVHAYLRRRAPQHADDLLSEVWLEAFRSRRQYDQARGEAAGWVFGVARNVVLGHLRRAGRHCGAAAAAEVHVEDWDAVDRRLDAAGLAPMLRDALAALTAEEREVLLLVAWEQLSPTEAAAALGIPTGTARSRLHRARSRITNAWNESSVTASREERR